MPRTLPHPAMMARLSVNALSWTFPPVPVPPEACARHRHKGSSSNPTLDRVERRGILLQVSIQVKEHRQLRIIPHRRTNPGCRRCTMGITTAPEAPPLSISHKAQTIPRTWFYLTSQETSSHSRSDPLQLPATPLIPSYALAYRSGLQLTPPCASQFFLVVSQPSLNDVQHLISRLVGYDGPNIYMRCLNALRSGISSEQAFALNHLVKISFERGDKFRFDSFPGLAEGLVDKVLQVGNLFYHIDWTVSWEESGDISCLDGNNGTPDIVERIDSLIEKDFPDALQPELYCDQLVLITEALLTIRNMVTLPENAHYMSDFPPLKDLICIVLQLPARDSLIELKHLALDVAEQLTPFMVLGSDDPLYKTLLSQMVSDDRGTILTALRALGRISMNLEATNKLGDVPQHVLHRVASWLLLNDDELMDACLDFLYQYTAVVPNVDHLLRSLVPENVVDQLVRLLSHGGRRLQKDFTLVPEQRLPSRDAIPPMPEDLLQEMLKLEEPERVHRWVECFFEEDKNSFVTQLAAWQAYQTAFVAPLKAVGQPLITPADFIRNSTSVYKDSNAQVLREPGDPQQKFIINGIRARPRPLGMDRTEYGRCLWANDSEKRNEKCGQFYLKSEQMWTHIMTSHLGEQKNDDDQFDNTDKEFRCTWGECVIYDKPTKMHLQDFARHVSTHVSSMLPGVVAQARVQRKAWIVPAKTLAVTYEETPTVRDERNPNLPPQAAGIPLSAVLVLRNIARNVVKTDAEEELVKQQVAGPERGGWNEKLFRPVLFRLFEILAENRAMVRSLYVMETIASLANMTVFAVSLHCVTSGSNPH